MPNNSSPPFTIEPENNLKEKLIRSIWLHKDKYCYLFESDGSYRLLSTERRGQYTILPDGRSVLLDWITDSFTEIAHQTTPIMPSTLQANQEVWWQAIQLGFGVTVKIVAISQSPSFSFNLMVEQDFAYHFNPRLSEGQIVQNTHIEYWGMEERLSLPQNMGLGHHFTLTITVQETELV